ncbi:MAG: DNA-3-methyladenine glycosylase [Sphingobacteriales bacterium]|nr:MAG: DNA-3-methyladenine glycosylase [Sphingobacteriales bacterium]
MDALKLTPAFFLREDVVQIARDLLGMVLVTEFDGQRTAGRIVETEAYAAMDKASHSHSNRRTNRTEPMFRVGGTAYVYRCYGIHHLFNISTNAADVAEAVLIRGVEPLEGIEIMQQRRSLPTISPKISAGPGNVTVALGIPGSYTRNDVFSDTLWFEDRGLKPLPEEVVVGTRVGVAYAEEDAYLPYRFWIQGSHWVSKAKGL